MSHASLAEQKKNEGNTQFKARNFPKAVELYSEAIRLDSKNCVYYSNRSAAYLAVGDLESAAADGRMCIDIDPRFVKGYHRLATALKDSGEYVEAVSVLDSGLRVNADHPDLKALLATLRPLAERQEKERRGTMSRAERFKAEGNDHFKRAEFELAIEKYTKAIEAGGGKASDEVVRSCYNNRAACHQQLSAFQKVVEDCTAVLEYDVRGLRFACDGTTSYAGRACRDGRGRLTPLQPENTKALLRRGLALEALERFRMALDDIRHVLRQHPENDIANRAQHRIGRVVRQLKKDGRSI